ncbi:MAG: hypothetical protein ABSE73_09295 [Planctomycetota bacterium]
MQSYRVFFVNGSTDVVDAESAAEARDKATKRARNNKLNKLLLLWRNGIIPFAVKAVGLQT